MKKSISVGNKKLRRSGLNFAKGCVGWGSSSGAALQNYNSKSLALGLTQVRKMLLLHCTITIKQWVTGSRIKVAKTRNKGCYSASCAHRFSSDHMHVGMVRKKVKSE